MHSSGVHAWQPGYVSESVIESVRAFGSDRGSESEGRVHICGEVFSNYQGFIEGCIRTVDGVLDSVGSAV